MPYYSKQPQDVLDELNSKISGLLNNEASERLRKYGANKLAGPQKKTAAQKFAEQIINPMIIVLIAAAVISAIMGEITDALVILSVIVLNSVLGVVQESKSEKSLEALQVMTKSKSKVKRDGEVAVINSQDIVPGDIVIIDAGDAVPADMRIIQSSTLKTNESALTGESLPINKTTDTLYYNDKSHNIPLGDRNNMAYMGTTAVYGHGEGIVTQTGMKTEIGKIAGAIEHAENVQTPLQKKLDSLSKILSICVLSICVLIFILSLAISHDFSRKAILNTFLLAVSLAVAAVPEGLACVVTIVLSIGVSKMSKNNAIIRKLTAVETLGCTDVICTDKTGTLTQNKMTVTDIFGDKEFLTKAMALCNDAHISAKSGNVTGEPTECALAEYSFKHGADKNILEEQYPRIGEAPFDSSRKMMSTVHSEGQNSFIQFTKGAPDEILKRCVNIKRNGKVVPITEKAKKEIYEMNSGMSGKALRVLAAAYKPLSSRPNDFSPEKLENGLIFIGLSGMTDPVRPEAIQAVNECKNAGIKPVMITGDHKDTAAAIAKQLGIINSDSEIITGSDLNLLSDKEFEQRISDYGAYARVQPEHKVRIVKAWKNSGKVTAMTGDGVNDAPAIKNADIGIGMGITGTDVTKNAADIILADDNFSTIVYAVKEGRRIYDNIKKAIQFLLSSNLSEVTAIFTATILGVTLFRPIHILWINLITDSFPAVALGVEEAENGMMHRPPRGKRESLFSGGMGIDILYQGIAIACLTIISYFAGTGKTSPAGTTMAFLTLSMCEVFHACNMRSQKKSIFTLHTHNKLLVITVVSALIIATAMIYVPGFANIFSLSKLSFYQYILSLVLAFAVVPFVECIKAIKRLLYEKNRI